MFGIKKPERKTISLVGFGRVILPVEPTVGSELYVHENREIGAGDESRIQLRVLKSGREMTIRFQALGGWCE